jgi:hypothetical protein
MTAMIRIKQHIPSGMPGAIPFQAEVATTTELLALPWVAAFVDLCDRVDPVDVSENPVDAPRKAAFVKSENALMVEGVRHGRAWWWVIGFLEDPSIVTLPEWVPKTPPVRYAGEATLRASGT